MNDAYKEFIGKITNDPAFICPVCRYGMYVTDCGNHEFTFHCSSREARFWDFERGSTQQEIARQHWDRSRREVFLRIEDVMNYVLKYESVSPERQDGEV